MKYWIRFVTVIGIMMSMSVIIMIATAQSEFAATLEVLSSGVEVQRTNTDTFIAVEIEGIVGVGDTIRTDETGEARITFFADGTDVTLDPNTDYRIVEFQGDDDDFQLTVEVLAGEATHRLNRALGARSSYDVETPGMTLAARGTIFAIRVEDTGRSGMLVFEGAVEASADGSEADVPQAFGVRSETDSDLSDVVPASTFDELDSALDGCDVVVTTIDDVSINVRVAPSLDAEQIGTVLASDIDTFVGVSESTIWYRIVYEDRFGWIISSSAEIAGDCSGLRTFSDSELADEVPADAPIETTEEANSED